MKSLVNKSVKIGNGELTYGELIRAVCRQAPQGGFTVEDVRKRMRVIDAVDLAEKNKANIQLEDADHETLKDCLAVMRWGVLDRAVVEFNDSIEKG